MASCLEERERVIDAGGQVKWQVDTWRVGHAALQVIPFFNSQFFYPLLYDKLLKMMSMFGMLIYFTCNERE